MNDPLLSPETEDRVARSRLRWYRTIGIVAVVTCLATLYGVTLLLDNSRRAIEQRNTQLQLATLLVECTTPPEERVPPVTVSDPSSDCYARALAQQAKAIGDPPAPINNVVILAAACADRAGVDTEAEIRECVLEGLR